MEPTPWLNANFKDPLFLSEAAAAMKAMELEAATARSAHARLTAGAGGGGDTGGGDGKSGEGFWIVDDDDDGALALHSDSQFALSLPGGGVLTAQSKTLPVGLYKLNAVAPPHSLQAPGFNTCAYEVKTWFQSLLFQILNLYRYSPDERSEVERRYPEFFVEKLRRDGGAELDAV
jgi:hypothetical protein